MGVACTDYDQIENLMETVGVDQTGKHRYQGNTQERITHGLVRRVRTADLLIGPRFLLLVGYGANRIASHNLEGEWTMFVVLIVYAALLAAHTLTKLCIDIPASAEQQLCSTTIQTCEPQDKDNLTIATEPIPTSDDEPEPSQDYTINMKQLLANALKTMKFVAIGFATVTILQNTPTLERYILLGILFLEIIELVEQLIWLVVCSLSPVLAVVASLWYFIQPKEQGIHQKQCLIPSQPISQECCSICFNPLDSCSPVCRLPCLPKHPFHTSCITPWLSISPSCPVCRHKFPRPL